MRRSIASNMRLKITEAGLLPIAIPIAHCPDAGEGLQPLRTRRTPRESRPKPAPSRGFPFEAHLARYSCPPPRNESVCVGWPGNRSIAFACYDPPLRERGRVPPPRVTSLRRPQVALSDKWECMTRPGDMVKQKRS